MTKEQFIHHHIDLIQILVAGGSGLGLMMTSIEQGVRIFIGFLTAGYIIYKWRCHYIDRKIRGK